MDAPSDGQLLRSFRTTNDQEAFSEIFRRHGGTVQAAAGTVVGPTGAVDDIAQAAFLTLARKARRLEHAASVAGWLHHVTVCLARDQRRRDRRRVAREQEALRLAAQADPPAALPAAVQAALHEELADLADRDRAPLILHHLEGLSYEATAVALRCHPNTLGPRLTRAREKLRRRLAARGVAFGAGGVAEILERNAPTAALPAALVASTCKVATLLATGNAVAGGLVSAHVIALTKGALNMLFWTKMKTVAGVAAVVALLGVTVAVVAATRPLGLAGFQAPGTVHAVAVDSVNGRVAGVCGVSREMYELIFFDLKTGVIQERIPLGKEDAARVRFLNGGSQVLVGCRVGWVSNGEQTGKLLKPRMLHLWDLKRKAEVHDFEEPPELDEKAAEQLPEEALFFGRHYSSMGAMALSADERYVFMVAERPVPTIFGWEIATGKLVAKLAEDANWEINAVAVSADGVRVAATESARTHATSEVEAGKASRRMVIRNWRSGKQEREWALPSHASGAQWLEKDQQLLAAGWDGTWIFDATNGKLLRQFPNQRNGILSPDARTLYFLTEGKLHALDFATGKEIWAIPVGVMDARDPSVSADGVWLAAMNYGSQSFLLVDLQNKKCVSPAGHSAKPRWLFYAPDGRLFVDQNYDVWVYDGATDGLLASMTLCKHYGSTPTFTKDGKMLWAGGFTEGQELELWDTVSGSLVKRVAPSVPYNFQSQHGDLKTLVLSPSGEQLLAETQYEKTMWLQDTRNGKCLIEWKPTDFHDYGSRIEACAWDKVEQRIFLADSAWQDSFGLRENAGGEPDSLTGAFDTQTGKRLYWFKSDNGKPLECAFLLRLCEERDLVFLDAVSQCGLWRASDGSFVRWVDSPCRDSGRKSNILQLVCPPVQFVNNNRWLAGRDALVDVETGRTIRRFTTGDKRVLSPSGTWLACLDKDWTLTLCDVRTGTEVWRRRTPPATVTNCSPDLLVWHPAETQIAVTMDGSPAAVQMNVFPPDLVKQAAALTAEQVRDRVRILASPDVTPRQTAMLELVKAGQTAIAVLREALTGNEVAAPTAVLGAQVLEWQARNGSAEARKTLETLAKNTEDNPAAAAAWDALLRLDAGDGVKDPKRQKGQIPPLAPGKKVNPALALAEHEPKTKEMAPPPPEEPVPTGPDVTLTTHQYVAAEAFDELRREGGSRVVLLGGWPWRDVGDNVVGPFVPVECRNKPMPGRELIRAVARTAGLRVAWRQEGRFAVLYSGAVAADVERVQRDLTSTAAAVRGEAAWRGGWLRDPQVVPLLVKAARDSDADVSRQAVQSLRRLTWDAVLAIDETASELMPAELAVPNVATRQAAFFALGQAGGEKALPLLTEALSDTDPVTRLSAAYALGSMRGGPALGCLGKALVDPDGQVRATAVEALGRIGAGRNALALLESAFADRDAQVRRYAACSVGAVGADLSAEEVEKGLALLQKALADPNREVRLSAAQALGQMGDRGLLLLEKELANPDALMRGKAVAALGRVGSAKALVLLEKMLTDTDDGVRCAVYRALGYVGGDQSLALLDKAIDNETKLVTAGRLDISQAYEEALGHIGGDRALAMIERSGANDGHSLWNSEWAYAIAGTNALPSIEKALASFEPFVRRSAAHALGTVGGGKTLALIEQALTDQDQFVRGRAIPTLGRFGGSTAILLLEQAMMDRDPEVRGYALDALGRVGGDRAVVLLEKALADETQRRYAAEGLEHIGGGEKVLALLGQSLVDSKGTVDEVTAAKMLARIGGKKALSLLETMLAAPDVKRRGAAAEALGFVGEAKALSLMEKALTDPDAKVRAAAAGTLGWVGGGTALALAKKAFADADGEVRQAAASGLFQGGSSHEGRDIEPLYKRGEKVRDLLLEQLAKEQDKEVKQTIRQVLCGYFGFLGDPAVENVHKDYLIEKLRDAMRIEGRKVRAGFVESLRKQLDEFRGDPAVDQALKESEPRQP